MDRRTETKDKPLHHRNPSLSLLQISLDQKIRILPRPLHNGRFALIEHVVGDGLDLEKDMFEDGGLGFWEGEGDDGGGVGGEGVSGGEGEGRRKTGGGGGEGGEEGEDGEEGMEGEHGLLGWELLVGGGNRLLCFTTGKPRDCGVLHSSQEVLIHYIPSCDLHTPQMSLRLGTFLGLN